MKTQRRIARVVALRKMRTGMWGAWCQAGVKDARPPLFSWEFLRSMWTLLCNVTRSRASRGTRGLFAWQERIGCTAPRSSGVYGRMN
ncbi:MAG: hypothetical protein LZF60_70074 [Nitrospira sp.]|nr:hypothetical protein [Nitrospira sp.]ULA58593.1 MAG: hypothetical protein LZF60_70074 [Nitrospira sp.]